VHHFRFLLAPLIALALAGAARAQLCEGRWLPETGVPEVAGTVLSMAEWDPDGDGPQASQMVVGGSFRVAGDQACNFIAAWDGKAWHPFGSGTTGAVTEVIVYHGELIACGQFTKAGGLTVNRIARWDGSTWSPLDSGLAITGSEVGPSAMVVFNDELVVCGSFSTAGGIAAKGVAKWNGSAWQSMCSGLTSAAGSFTGPGVYALAIFNGQLFGGGSFSVIDGANANSIARWTGTTWVPLGSGVAGGAVYGLEVFQDSLVACGSFTSAGPPGSTHVARWDGSNWLSLASGIGAGTSVNYPLTMYSDGYQLLMGGNFRKNANYDFDVIARWNGSAWSSPEPAGLSAAITVAAIAPFNGELLVGGGFTQLNGCRAMNLVRWTGSSWLRLPSLTDWFDFFSVAPVGSVDGLAFLSGTRNLADGTIIQGLLSWDGSTWSKFGGESILSAYSVQKLAGELHAAGSFASEGATVRNVARWDGEAWHQFGSGMSGTVRAMVEYQGAIHAAGSFTSADGVPASLIARWNGSTWEPLGLGLSGGSSPKVTALVVRDGELFAGGTFTSAGALVVNHIARWDGAQWKDLGGGVAGPSGTANINDLALYHGDLIAAGSFTTAGGITAGCIARWDGSAWHALGSGLSSGSYIYALAVANEALFAGGSFFSISGKDVFNIARWNGTQWKSPGTGLGNAADWLAVHNDEVLAGGEFTTAGGVVSCYFARWTDTNKPWIAQGPRPATIFSGEAQSLTVLAAAGHDSLAYQWRRVLDDGSRADLFDDGHFSGTTTPTLTLANAEAADAGAYECVVSNACGSDISDIAILRCATDADRNGFVNGDDFDFFVGAFISGEGSADIDGNGFVNGDDFDRFEVAFETGC